IMDVKERLTVLRKKMDEVGVDTAVIPTSDRHNSEYVGPCFKFREYLSGFTGSAGTLIVCRDSAYLHTDSRYFIQAEDELSGSGISLMKDGNEGVPSEREHLKSLCPEGSVLWFDASCFTAVKGAEMVADHPGARTDLDPDEGLWPGRPAQEFGPVFILEKRYSGVTAGEKIALIREKMNSLHADVHVISSLDNIAWILNLRGCDIEHCPVFYSYLIITPDKVFLYADIKGKDIEDHLSKTGVILKKYESFYEDLGQSTIFGTGHTVLLDKKDVNFRIYRTLSETGSRIVSSPNPSALMKAVKNKTERENFKKAHLLDAAAVIRFEKWLYEVARSDEKLTELSVAEKLHEFRKETDSFIDESFDTICAFGANAAIVHYGTDADHDDPLERDGILLIDSGGHYYEGTTDITRTYILGEGIKDSEEFKKFKHDFTLVAISMLKLMNLKFVKGTRGSSLDMIARQTLWNNGLDFGHGTGHGVGYLLNVHEGPNRISYRAGKGSEDAVFEAGMVTSDEPGIYIRDSYGIRIENLILCVEDSTNDFGRFLSFEPLTMVPIDLRGIDPELMSEEDIEMLNRYHQTVYEKVSPYLDEDMKAYLKKATERIG
ncbi:MAG: aminopeptidase P family protein, partial [Lachnospiraceae bacterium]|nr:aminopeptidase P family protein [Lachnospiraceae bacterium]